MSRSGREALPDIQEYPRMSVCVWEVFLDVWEWSGGLRMSVCGWKHLPDIREL